LSLDGLKVAEAKQKITPGSKKKISEENHQLQAARLAVQPAALLGEPFPIIWKKDAPGICVTKRCRKVHCRCCRRPRRLQTHAEW